MKKKIILITSLLVIPQISIASDGEPQSVKRSNDVADTGSAASFDKRLPPVIPGEQIEHNGRKMKVWSTSGEVPVGQVPPAPPAPDASGQNLNSLSGVGVIVDQRDNNSRR